MINVFGLNIEFDRNVFDNTISTRIKEQGIGYVCVIDGNVLTMTYKNIAYQIIVNSACVNTCDGSSIAMMANWIYKTKYGVFNGPQLFEEYIEKDYRQIILGNSEDIFENVKIKLQERGIKNDLFHLSLPFLDVENFDYPTIAQEINRIKPDIIWVSLGAPKQEVFMSKIQPYLDRGIMFGIGAAVNFYTGAYKIPSFKMNNFSFIWLKRMFTEPKKQIKRVKGYISIFPFLFIDEIRKNRKKV